MKRLLLVASAAIAFVASAKPEKILDVTLANQQGIIDAATKIGEFTDNPMLGMMATGLFSANPLVAQGFGPVRADGNLYAAVYLDAPATGNLDADALFGQGVKFAVVYPTAAKKADFLAANPALKEENGAIVNNDIYVVFSDEAKCACIGSDVVTVRKTLADKIAKLKKGEAFRINVTEAGMNIFSRLIESEAKKPGAQLDQAVVDVVKTVKGGSYSLFAGSYGVDFAMSLKSAPGSYLSKVGNKPLSTTAPLAFAGKDALLAGACAADSGSGDFNADWNKVLAFAARWGIKTDWIVTEKNGSNWKLTLDPAKLAAYSKGEAEAKVKELEPKALEVLEDAKKTFKTELKVENPEHSVAFYLKGAKVPVDAQTRFNAALPGYVGKPCAAVGVGSLYGLIVSVAEVVAPHVGSKEAGEIKAALSALPPATGATIAYAWTKPDVLTHNVVVRFNPHEIKGLFQFGMFFYSKTVMPAQY